MSYEKDQIAKKERRERMAIKCLQGLLANGDTAGCLPSELPTARHKSIMLQQLCMTAVEYADALITELDKESKK